MLDARGFACFVISVGLLLSCGQSSRLKPADVDTPDQPRPTHQPLSDAAPPSSSGDDASATDGAAPTDSAMSTAAPAPSTMANCGEILCSGHGRCLEEDGLAACACDDGYFAEERAPGEYECVVDKSCIKVHALQETGCIQLVNSAPAVAVFFAVDYCSGTAVLPDELGDLNEAFRILENDKDISDETVARVVERDVESYVAITLDISKSVTGVGETTDPDKRIRLSALIEQMRDFVGALRAPDGKPPVSVSLQVFARFSLEYVPFTDDLEKVDAALVALAAEPETVVAQVGGANASALHDATQHGIQSVERIQRLRNVVTQGGVLTSGTLVVVTDGDDNTGAPLDKTQLGSTLVNVISIGISSQIEDDTLGSIGIDGSFLAPTEGDWITAFGEIAERVRQYPERAYLLSYCSPASGGKPEVSVTLRDIEPKETAGCKYDAELFSKDGDVAGSCDANFFATACDEIECGSPFACGACADDSCCVDGKCQAPSSASNCRDQDALCAPSSGRCQKVANADEYACEPGPQAGTTCGTSNLCSIGTYCGEPDEMNVRECVAATLENGDSCKDADDKLHGEWCPERNCGPGPTTGSHLCLPQARANDACSGSDADATCEPGTYCKSNVCRERAVFANCTTDEECASGYCDDDVKACASTGACYFSWESILNP